MNNIKQLVIEEATKLREHATEEERARLDIENLFPNLSNACIYGQITGNCWSARAVELLNLCALPFSGDIDEIEETEDDKFSSHPARAYSPIEVFIYNQDPVKVHILVAYIKGQRNTLTIEDLS